MRKPETGLPSDFAQVMGRPDSISEYPSPNARSGTPGLEQPAQSIDRLGGGLLAAPLGPVDDP